MVNWTMIGAMILPNIGGWVGGLITGKNIPTWYSKLRKPRFLPPNWIFGPVWTTLYTSMGYASYLVWRDGNGFAGDARLPLIIYGVHLLLNWMWTPIFFGMHKLGAAFVEILLLLGSIFVTAKSFYDVNPTAGMIFVPYMCWGTFATFLNYNLWIMNKDRKY